ncbi:hypothetical protein E2I00_015006, partial [Balaenoptera physalus]
PKSGRICSNKTPIDVQALKKKVSRVTCDPAARAILSNLLVYITDREDGPREPPPARRAEGGVSKTSRAPEPQDAQRRPTRFQLLKAKFMGTGREPCLKRTREVGRLIFKDRQGPGRSLVTATVHKLLEKAREGAGRPAWGREPLGREKPRGLPAGRSSVKSILKPSAPRATAPRDGPETVVSGAGPECVPRAAHSPASPRGEVLPGCEPVMSPPGPDSPGGTGAAQGARGARLGPRPGLVGGGPGAAPEITLTVCSSEDETEGMTADSEPEPLFAVQENCPEERAPGQIPPLRASGPEDQGWRLLGGEGRAACHGPDVPEAVPTTKPQKSSPGGKETRHSPGTSHRLPKHQDMWGEDASQLSSKIPLLPGREERPAGDAGTSSHRSAAPENRWGGLAGCAPGGRQALAPRVSRRSGNLGRCVAEPSGGQPKAPDSSPGCPGATGEPGGGDPAPHAGH